MSKLFKMSISQNYKTTDKGGTVESSFTGIQSYVENLVTEKDGFDISLKEMTFDFTKLEIEFSEAYKKIELAKKGVWHTFCTPNYPSNLTLDYGEIKCQNDAFEGKILTKTLRKNVEDFIEESLYVFVREGMSTIVSFAREAYLEAPIKSNRKGLSLRGYSANLKVDTETMEESDFYKSIFELFKV